VIEDADAGKAFIESGARSQDDAVLVFPLDLLCWWRFQRCHDGLSDVLVVVLHKAETDGSLGRGEALG